MRFKPYDRPGVLRLGTWLTSTFPAPTTRPWRSPASTPAPASPPTTPSPRPARAAPNTGLYVNLQQELTDDIGLFGRFSWNDGRTEIGAFTDIDTSLSLGLSIKGTAWKRPDDRIGIAGALNQISADHSNYLAAGGLGVLVGDGALSYAPENVVEAYYALQVVKGIIATADYQFLNNPGYNTVRGPAHFFSGRLSARF